MWACCVTAATGQQVPRDAYHIYVYESDGYEARFEEVRRCMEYLGWDTSSKHFDEIEWYLVPHKMFSLFNGGPYIGYYDNSNWWKPRIYLIQGLWKDPVLVRHEIMHYFLTGQLPLGTIDVHPEPPYGVCEYWNG